VPKSLEAKLCGMSRLLSFKIDKQLHIIKLQHKDGYARELREWAWMGWCLPTVEDCTALKGDYINKCRNTHTVFVNCQESLILNCHPCVLTYFCWIIPGTSRMSLYTYDAWTPCLLNLQHTSNATQVPWQRSGQNYDHLGQLSSFTCTMASPGRKSGLSFWISLMVAFSLPRTSLQPQTTELSTGTLGRATVFKWTRGC